MTKCIFCGNIIKVDKDIRCVWVRVEHVLEITTGIELQGRLQQEVRLLKVGKR